MTIREIINEVAVFPSKSEVVYYDKTMDTYIECLVWARNYFLNKSIRENTYAINDWCFQEVNFTIKKQDGKFTTSDFPRYLSNDSACFIKKSIMMYNYENNKEKKTTIIYCPDINNINNKYVNDITFYDTKNNNFNVRVVVDGLEEVNISIKAIFEDFKKAYSFEKPAIYNMLDEKFPCDNDKIPYVKQLAIQRIYGIYDNSNIIKKKDDDTKQV